MSEPFYDAVGGCLSEADVDAKLATVRRLWQTWLRDDPVLEGESPQLPVAGRPQRPTLVAPAKLARRSLATAPGRAAMVHAFAHIEFNAINLALDAAWRFRGLPRQWVGDWLGVAAEEAEHFALLRGRLRDWEMEYGDLPAHNGLWEMAERTAGDVLARMAVVPRALEARGLDVSPRLIKGFDIQGDSDTARILERILRDEIGHVYLGSYWFEYLCRASGREPETTWFGLVQEYLGGLPRGPFHHQARREAGFSESELERLDAQTG